MYFSSTPRALRVPFYPFLSLDVITRIMYGELDYRQTCHYAISPFYPLLLLFPSHISLRTLFLNPNIFFHICGVVHCNIYIYQIIIIIIIIIITYSVLREFLITFRSQFSTVCDLVLPRSISSVPSLPQGHLLAAYLFFLVFPASFAIRCIFHHCVLESSFFAKCGQSN